MMTKVILDGGLISGGIASCKTENTETAVVEGYMECCWYNARVSDHWVKYVYAITMAAAGIPSVHSAQSYARVR